ncbi:hypothetical protein AB0F52_28300 [Amycolatopsis sp. NPDC024027]|uniref:hypothetical protein n=1 Tax=Amycolatopsis sp. NPDC024027 TaxID=3154327 RepID=UPI0033CECEE2
MPSFDYFRAPDADAVRQVMDAGGGRTAVGDGIEAKGVDPTVVLGMMIAAIQQVPWNPDLVADSLVWPAGREQDPDYDGPWVSELNTSTRDVLAQARRCASCGAGVGTNRRARRQRRRGGRTSVHRVHGRARAAGSGSRRADVLLDKPLM